MPLFHSATKKQLEAAARTVPQALIIAGKKGSGLHTAAREILVSTNATVQTISPEKDGKPDVDAGSIGVAVIRQLYDRTTTSTATPRIIIIEYAETMTEQAQNAFLKLLEEPNASIHFILLTHSAESLLPTVRSRAQRITVRAISDSQSQQLLDDLKVTDATKRQQLLFLAAGRPALLAYYASNPAKLEAKAATIRDARSFLGGSSYDRLAAVTGYVSSRQKAVEFVEFVGVLLQRAVAASDEANLPVLTNKIDACEQALQRLHANSNIRLSLLALAIA